MSLLALPVERLGGRGPLPAGACLGAAVLLLTAAGILWASEAPPPLWAVLAAAGGALGSAGAACLLLPRGRLAAGGRALLDAAGRHHEAGLLSEEGFQATRERLHARAAAGSVPQAALALSLFGASLMALAFALAASLFPLVEGAGDWPDLAALAAAGACAFGALGLGVAVLAEASRWRGRARAEASTLRRMLADLEADVLDEVRRSERAQTEPGADLLA